MQTIVLELYATFLLQPDLRAFISCGLPKRTQDSVALFVIFRQIFQIEFFMTFCLLSKHSFKSLVAKATTKRALNFLLEEKRKLSKSFMRIYEYKMVARR